MRLVLVFMFIVKASYAILLRASAVGRCSLSAPSGRPRSGGGGTRALRTERGSRYLLRATTSDVLYDMPVSNHGARCRMIAKAKGIEGSGVIVQPPSQLGGLQSEQYKKLNPNGKMPLLVTDVGYPIAESDTICRYLIEKYAAKDPSFVPSDARLRVLSEQIVRQHDIYITPIQGAMYKAPGYVFSAFGSDRGKALDDLVKQLETIESFLATFDQVHGPNLRRGGYLCGDSISLADATLFPTMIFFQFMLPRFFDVTVPGRMLNEWHRRIISNDEAAFEIKEEIEGSLRVWESNKRWEPIIEEKQRAAASGAGWGRQLTAALLIGSSPFLIDPFTKMDGNLVNFVANADSTGKMSTKLTARKRYLPRIIAGVSEFEATAKAPISPQSDLFLLGKDSQSASLVRAMRLYGASLRKGEVPDTISREADELCNSFQKDIDSLSKSRSTQDAEKARKSLLAYLTFAKIA